MNDFKWSFLFCLKHEVMESKSSCIRCSFLFSRQEVRVPVKDNITIDTFCAVDL